MLVHFSLSPAAYDAIADFVQDAEMGPEDLEEALSRVCDAAKRFSQTFAGTNFIKHEKVHEFTALELYNEQDLQQRRFLPLRMTIKHDTAYIFSTDELPLDAFYDVRKCITESQFACYNDGPVPPASHF